jgi:hypothetical protein
VFPVVRNGIRYCFVTSICLEDEKQYNQSLYCNKEIIAQIAGGNNVITIYLLFTLIVVYISILKRHLFIENRCIEYSVE